MAGITEFSIEGEATFEWHDDGRRVKIGNDRIEELIARQFDFPSDEEFDQMISRIGSLREQGLATAEGEPDITRKVKLKIEVEMVDEMS